MWAGAERNLVGVAMCCFGEVRPHHSHAERLVSHQYIIRRTFANVGAHEDFHETWALLEGVKQLHQCTGQVSVCAGGHGALDEEDCWQPWLQQHLSTTISW